MAADLAGQCYGPYLPNHDFGMDSCQKERTLRVVREKAPSCWRPQNSLGKAELLVRRDFWALDANQLL